MNRLLVVGAGGLGREVVSWSLQIPSTMRDWELGGVLDLVKEPWDVYGLPAQIIGCPDTYEFAATDRAVVAVGDPSLRLRIAESLTNRGVRFANVIHPSVTMGFDVRWGTGCMFFPNAIVSTNVTIGNHVLLNSQSMVGHDAKVGDGCTLCGHAEINGHVTLGKACFLGSHASVLPNAHVGDRCVIGAGSVAMRSVEEGTTLFGVPGRTVFRRSMTA